MLALAVGVVCLAVVGNVVEAARQGWTLEGDDAAIAINAFDTAHGHVRLLGPPTSAVLYAGIGVFHHPGPMLYWLSTLPAGLLGWGPGGFLLFAALVNVVAVVVTAVFLRRRAGTVVATWLVAAVGLLLWAVGPEAPHDIWNPHIAVLPWLLTLVLLWSVIDGDPVALVPLAVSWSFVVQDHYGYLPVAAPLLAGGLAAVAGRWWRARRRGAVPPATRRWVVHGGVAAAVGAACWAPVAVQQVTGDPGNVSQLVRYVTTDPPHGRQGSVYGFDRLVGFFGLRPSWLDRSPTILDFVRSPSVADVVVAAVVLGAAAVLCWHHLRRGRATIGRLLALNLSGLVLLAVSAASLPKEVLSSAAPYNYLPWWPVCLLAWCGLVWGAVDLAAVRIGGRAPGPTRRSSRPRTGIGGPAAQLAAVAAAVVLAVAVVAGTHVGDDRAAGMFPAIDTITAGTRASLPKPGPYYVVGRGEAAYLSFTNPVVLDLVRHGYRVRLPADREEFLGTFRRPDSRHLAGVVLVRSGRPQPPPEGARVLAEARIDPRADGLPTIATDRVVAYLLPASALGDLRAPGGVVTTSG